MIDKMSLGDRMKQYESFAEMKCKDCKYFGSFKELPEEETRYDTDGGACSFHQIVVWELQDVCEGFVKR